MYVALPLGKNFIACQRVGELLSQMNVVSCVIMLQMLKVDVVGTGEVCLVIGQNTCTTQNYFQICSKQLFLSLYPILSEYRETFYS